MKCLIGHKLEEVINPFVHLHVVEDRNIELAKYKGDRERAGISNQP